MKNENSIAVNLYLDKDINEVLDNYANLKVPVAPYLPPFTRKKQVVEFLVNYALLKGIIVDPDETE